jgi:predicted small lipoprotein YifL
LYGAARIGDFVVNRNFSPASSRWAVILLSAALLALAGCGRKGGLDLPPNAPAPSANAVEADPERAPPKATVFDPNYGSDAGPVAAKGRKKSFVLDPLLNSQ